MSRRLPSTFSVLHRKAILENRLAVTASARLRKRIWHLLNDYNDSVGVQRDPNDRWIDNSDVKTEILTKLHRLYGVESLTVKDDNGQETTADLAEFVAASDPAHVFDVIQLWFDDLAPDRQRTFQLDLNDIFEEEAFPWCFCERHFFQIDSRFLEAKVQSQVHELLHTKGHLGAMQEFVEARNDFAAGDFKGTMLNSCKAFESVMQGIIGKNGGQAGDLIKELKGVGILDDLPINLRGAFESKVLQTVPFLRNTLAGHGQGQQVVTVSRELAELCLHLAGSLILFCIRRHLVLNPTSVQSTPPALDDELPF